MMRELGRAPGAYRPTMSFLEWTKLGLPFALVSSFLTTFVILRLFLSREERATPLAMADVIVPPKLTGREIYILSVVALTILLWLTQSLHGVEITIITLCAAIGVTIASPSGRKIKDSFKSVDWNLLLFIAGASLIGEALIDTNAAGDLIRRFASAAGDAVDRPLFVVAFISLGALLAHLVITSRTARATAIIPLLAFPFAQFGYNGTALIFLAVVASGYCLTLTISAKSLLIYSNPTTGTTFTHGELLRLSAVLLPSHLGLLIAFAMYIWPWLGLPLFAPAIATAP
jgi:di/tricarboxylate transporter